RETVVLRRELGDKHGLSFSLLTLGKILLEQARMAEAEGSLDQAIAVQDEIGKTPIYVSMMSMKAFSVFLSGRFDLAAQLAQAGLDVAQGHYYLGMTSVCRAVMGFEACMGEAYDRGRELCQIPQDMQLRFEVR